MRLQWWDELQHSCSLYISRLDWSIVEAKLNNKARHQWICLNGRQTAGNRKNKKITQPIYIHVISILISIYPRHKFPPIQWQVSNNKSFYIFNLPCLFIYLFIFVYSQLSVKILFITSCLFTFCSVLSFLVGVE